MDQPVFTALRRLWAQEDGVDGAEALRRYPDFRLKAARQADPVTFQNWVAELQRE